MPFLGLDYLRQSLTAIRLSIEHQRSTIMEMHYGLMIIHQNQIYQHTALMIRDTENLILYNLIIELHTACRIMHERMLTHLTGTIITWERITVNLDDPPFHRQ